MADKIFVGLDIGYSNLKIVFNDPENPKSVITELLPVGAAPVSQVMQGVAGDKGSSLIQVDVDGEKWYSAIDPSLIQGLCRVIHENYPSSNQYKALFLGALARIGAPVIDRLVTGLPVNQYLDKKYTQDLKDQLTGVHKLNSKVSVEVKEVLVVPQPIGAYMDMTQNVKDDELLELIANGQTLVLDPGFFSVDWVTIVGGSLATESCGTSLDGVSVILEKTASYLSAEYAGTVNFSKLEKCVVEGKRQIALSGAMRDFTEFLEKAIQDHAPRSVNAMQNDLRKNTFTPDVIILAGGGAKFFKETTQRIFKNAKIIVLDRPEVSNANGFWLLGAAT